MYFSEITNLFLPALIVLIISIIFSIFSPFGILFIIFSIVRWKSENQSVKKVSLVIQIICAVMTLIVGILIGALFVIQGSPVYLYGSGGWMGMAAVVLGVVFACIVSLAVIVWQTREMSRTEDSY